MFYYNLTRIMGTLSEDLCTLMVISLIFFRMENVSDKICRETQNMHFMFNNFYLKKNCSFREIM
jgi:hypothetical protein